MLHLVTMGILLLFGFCAAGCRPTNPLEEKVDGRTPFGFVMWRAQIAEKQTPQERQELAEMIQEVNYWVTTNGIATGSVAIDEAVREEIDGVTVRELLLKGYEAKRQRLDLEKVMLEDDVATNSRLQTRPGDTDSADYLALVRQEQTDRLDKIIRDLRFINKRLDELGGSPHPGSDRRNTEPMDMQPQLLTTTGH
jgi:hypothetical protein